MLELLRRGKLKSTDNKQSSDFAYHQPCHLLALGGTASIELLEKLCNIKVEDLNAGCCGLAGTFGMQKKNYELSEKIAQKLKKALEESAAGAVLTECAACVMQIEHISGKSAMHPIKVIAKCYGQV